MMAKARSQRSIRWFLADDSGSAAEYGILISLIALAVLGGITALGTAVIDRLYTPALALFP
jgi:Flp pilus assembly pilin Flp